MSSETPPRESQRVDITKLSDHSICVVTDADTEEAFLWMLTRRLRELFDIAVDGPDEPYFDLHGIIEQSVEICCALRGYKSTVKRSTVLCAGPAWPGVSIMWSTSADLEKDAKENREMTLKLEELQKKIDAKRAGESDGPCEVLS